MQQWNAPGARDHQSGCHFLQFYEPSFGIPPRDLAPFVEQGWRQGGALLVIATPAHAAYVERIAARLQPGRSEAGRNADRLILLDAQETLARILAQGQPDWELFERTLGQSVRELVQQPSVTHVRIYGETAGMLWERGEFAAALRIEQFWNRLRESVDFMLLCAYPIGVLSTGFSPASLDGALAAHTHVLPCGGAPGFDAVLSRAVAETLGPEAGPQAISLQQHETGWPALPAPEAQILNLKRSAPKQAGPILERAQDLYRRQFQRLVEHCADAVCLVDAEGRLISALGSVEELLGHFDGETARGLFEELVHPEDAGEFRNLIEFALREPAEPRRVRLRIRRADVCHDWRLVSCKATNLIGVPDVRALVLALSEVDARRLEGGVPDHEAAFLAERYQRYRDLLHGLLEHIPMGVTISDADGRIRWMSRYGWDLTGHDPASAANFPAGQYARCFGVYRADGVTPATDDDLPLARAAHGELVKDEEWIVQRPDGRRIWTLCNAGPIRNYVGEIAGAVTAWTDITARKNLEDSLRLSEQRLALAQAAGKVGTWEWNNRANTGICSPEWFRIHGLPQRSGGRLELSEWIPLLHSDDREKPWQDFATAVKQGGQCVSEYRIRRPDGEMRWISTTATVFLGPDNEPDRMIGISQDITARKRTEAAAQQITDDLRSFAYTAAHELKGPLRLILDHVSVLTRSLDGRLGEHEAGLLGAIRTNTARMQTFLRDLLEYSQVAIDQGVSRRRAEISFEDVLCAALFLLLAEINESGAEVTHEPLPRVLADGGQFIQVFQNLIGNAIKYRSSRTPAIHVAGIDKGECWQFSVRDNGIGLGMEFAGKIFAPFQRLHAKSAIEGSGVGLTICRRIVERHGGRIWVASEPGNGSTFYFT